MDFAHIKAASCIADVYVLFAMIILLYVTQKSKLQQSQNKKNNLDQQDYFYKNGTLAYVASVWPHFEHPGISVHQEITRHMALMEPRSIKKNK